MRITSTAMMYVMRGDDEFDLHIYGEGYYDAGRISGPPDSCYPPEGELEIILIETGDGKQWQGELTDEEYDRAVGLLWENYDYEEPSYPDYQPDDNY